MGMLGTYSGSIALPVIIGIVRNVEFIIVVVIVIVIVVVIVAT